MPSARRIFFYALNRVLGSVSNNLAAKSVFLAHGSRPPICQGKMIVSGFGSDVTLGDDNRFYEGSVLELGNEGKFQSGHSCMFSYNSVIACHCEIRLGDNVLIGENVSIRDSMHDTTADNYRTARDISRPIVIGNNVWIGKGSIVLPGSIIPDNTIVGALSLIKGELKPGYIYGGVPAKVIGSLPGS